MSVELMELLTILDTRQLALAVHLDLTKTEDIRALSKTEAEDIEYGLPMCASYSEREFDHGNAGTYWVLTEDEADAEWDRQLDDYIDECVLPEMPEHLRSYFDEESWKRDARMDGRGHVISSYDGHEHDYAITDMDGDVETFYVYRIN